MNKNLQIVLSFVFGVLFLFGMILISILLPYPSEFQLFTFRVTLSLAAGGVVAMIPGFLSVNISSTIRAGGAVAAIIVIYFFNPAELTVKGKPTDIDGLFISQTDSDRELTEYYWKQADLKFKFPTEGWRISSKAAESGLGDIILQHESGKDVQIQLHVSQLDSKYQDNWELFESDTTAIWKNTISQFGPFSVSNLFIDGRPSFQMKGVIIGQQGINKDVDLTYIPLGDNRLFEMHLTRNQNHGQEQEFVDAYDLIASTIRFDKDDIY